MWEGRVAPKIGEIVTRVKENKEANEDFLRSWLMLAVSTSLCPPTSTGISPRCYPTLVDLCKVKDLNWCQFVVDQLKHASSNLNKKNSVRGYIQLLAVLYADSVEVQNLQPPATKPRIAAWTRKMLDTVIIQDTNRDGSFGKLKLKNLAQSVLQDPFIQMDDVQRYVSSMAPRGTTDKNKRKLSQAVIKVISGVTQLLGTFVHEVGALGIGQDQETSGPSSRRSKRKRTTEHEEPDLVDEDIAEEPGFATDPDYEEEPEFVDKDTTENSDYEDEGDAHNMDSYHTSNIDPSPEVGEEAANDTHGILPEANRNDAHGTIPGRQRSASTSNIDPSPEVGEEAANDTHGTLPEANGNDAHGTISGGQRSASTPEHDQTDEQDHIPLISRLSALQEAKNQRVSDQAPESMHKEPVVSTHL